MGILRNRYGLQWGRAANYAALLDAGITSYWKMDEATSITRDDAKGTNDLAVTGTVNAAAGKIGNAIDLSARNGSNRLSIADTATLRVTTAFGWWTWVNVSVIDGTAQILGVKGTGTGITAAEAAWLARIATVSGEDRFRWRVCDGVNSFGVECGPSTFPGFSFTTSAWHLLYGGWDGVNAYAGVDAKVSSAGGLFLKTVAPAILDSGTFSLVVGASPAGGAPVAGLVDEMGFIQSRALTEADISLLWNGGVGRTYPYS